MQKTFQIIYTYQIIDILIALNPFLVCLKHVDLHQVGEVSGVAGLHVVTEAVVLELGEQLELVELDVLVLLVLHHELQLGVQVRDSVFVAVVEQLPQFVEHLWLRVAQQRAREFRHDFVVHLVGVREVGELLVHFFQCLLRVIVYDEFLVQRCIMLFENAGLFFSGNDGTRCFRFFHYLNN